MSTTIVKRIYFEKDEVVKEFNDFFRGEDEGGVFSRALAGLYEDLKPIFQKRFIKMNKGYCFDREVSGAWLGLCEDDFEYLRSYDSETPLDMVLDDLRSFYHNPNIDLPTKEELLKLTKLKEAPFPITEGRPEKPDCYMLYKVKKYESCYVQGFDMDIVYLSEHQDGKPLPIVRLGNKKELNDKELLLLWIKNGLKPIEIDNHFYDFLLNVNFVLDDEFNIVDIEGEIDFEIDSNFLVEKLRRIDHTRADLIEYDSKMFFDVNKGSWEVHKRSHIENFQNPIEIKLSKPLIARDPHSSIVEGIIGIDFGTKSTVVVHQNDREKILPMRIGIGDWTKKEESYHFENPTVMEFRDLESFLKAYKAKDFRPYTKWKDLTISHIAYENMKMSSADKFNAYLTELKQWAGDSRRKIKIEDYQKRVFELPAFIEMGPDDINPIELYAYYIGLYINNQFNGIYLSYILSFPVTYEKRVREKIVESFRRGIIRSLPPLKDKLNDLRVIEGVSEPAAYAAIAIEEYGLADEEKIFYSVFDFGGGTTDFDFGIFRWANENHKKERRYDYVIEHFGAGGDQFLGGENLLEMLAFEVFKDNKEILLKENISFVLPPECDPFVGSEVLISDSREARLNMISLMDTLRVFWERETFEGNVFESGIIKISLHDVRGELKSQIELKVDEEKLMTILTNRIQKGVDSFFELLREAFFGINSERFHINEVNIFLAGNSSKSPIVKELFERKIRNLKEEARRKGQDIHCKLFPPLDNKDNFEKPNGKTGVAFGLIETRPGGKILVYDKNVNKDTNEIKFKYYLGTNRRKKFKVIIPRDVKYDKWVEFIDAGEEFFELYYTTSPLAMKNDLSINDPLVKKKRLKIDVVDEDASVFIKVISPTVFEYSVSKDRQNFEGIKRVDLAED
jgi:hypothetical protein